ncbi:hypothetical protein [Lacimicrobium sp. SS2-24]|uniref:hypothetical protein n=1 Tax=Lacimicrobium sp. SS2-24 TaxID=2005569 RepID=UPI000B4A8C38|nr:hypothetical protein [Lacimicrobium sp. SS2-24]
MKNTPDRQNKAQKDNTKQKDEHFSHHDAEVASPEEGSLCGEEDPGAALESLIDHRDEKHKD